MTGESAATAASPAEIAAWEDFPKRQSMPGDAPLLSVDGFEGPLDWLLEMARARKIDLAKLSLLALIESFVAALETALAGRDAARIGPWAAWIVMAASLTEMWSRLLLPADSPEAGAAMAEAEALRRDFVRRAQLRAAADWLELRPQMGQAFFARGMPENHSGHRVGDLTDLLRAYLVAMRVPEQAEIAARPRPPRFWTVAEAIRRIQRALEENPGGAELLACVPQIPDGAGHALRCRAAVASTLIAGLELARTQELFVDQDADSAPIILRAAPQRATGSFPPV